VRHGAARVCAGLEFMRSRVIEAYENPNGVEVEGGLGAGNTAIATPTRVAKSWRTRKTYSDGHVCVLGISCKNGVARRVSL
jgi:hypothetical protein